LILYIFEYIFPKRLKNRDSHYHVNYDVKMARLEYHLSRQRNKLVLHGKTWLNFENIILNGKSLSEKPGTMFI
jgi:hypothetical protein